MSKPTATKPTATKPRLPTKESPKPSRVGNYSAGGAAQLSPASPRAPVQSLVTTATKPGRAVVVPGSPGPVRPIITAPATTATVASPVSVRQPFSARAREEAMWAALAQAARAESAAEDEYKEDFEGYDEDDFEKADDDDASDEEDDGNNVDTEANANTIARADPRPVPDNVERIQAAMAAENQRAREHSAGRALPASQAAGEPIVAAPTSSTLSNRDIKPRMTFSTRANGSRSSAMQQRARDLAAVIELGATAFSLLDLPPLSEYELYIRSYGRLNTAQAGGQTNDDVGHQGLQTDEVPTRTRWSQHPAANMLAAGVAPDSAHVADGWATSSRAARQAAVALGLDGGSGDTAARPTETDVEIGAMDAAADAEALRLFMARAAPVCLRLLEENLAVWGGGTLVGRPTSHRFSSHCTIIAAALPFLKDRPVVGLRVAAARAHHLVTVFAPCTERGVIHRKGAPDVNNCVAVWNLREPALPQKILGGMTARVAVCEGAPTCCCFGPDHAALLLAGTADGSVVVWDLREAAALHASTPPVTIDGAVCAMRQPSFVTDGLLGDVNHAAPIVDLQVVLVAGATGESLASAAVSCQFATLDRAGTLKTWTVVELPVATPTGSLVDLGLLPGARMKIQPSMTVVLSLPAAVGTAFPVAATTAFSFFPGDANQLVAACTTGSVLHAVRFGGACSPRVFAHTHGSTAAADAATALDPAPLLPGFFAVGYHTGAVSVFSNRIGTPLWTWAHATAGQPVQWLRWSPHRAGVLYVIDAANVLHIWDLLEADAGPVLSEPLASARAGAGCTITAADLSPNLSGQSPSLIFATSTGGLECHALADVFVLSKSVDEVACVKTLLETGDQFNL